MQYFPNETIPLKNLNLCEVIDEGIIVTNVYVTHMCLIKQKYFPNPEILELYQKKSPSIYEKNIPWLGRFLVSKFFLLLDFWSALRLVF